MGRPGLWELFIIALLIIVIFGNHKMPELGRSLGQAWTNFRRGLKTPEGPSETPGRDSAQAGEGQDQPGGSL